MMEGDWETGRLRKGDSETEEVELRDWETGIMGKQKAEKLRQRLRD